MASTVPIKVPILGVDKFTKEFKKTIKLAEKMGKAVTAVGKKMTAAVTVPIVGIGAASLKMADTFNEAMSSVGTLIPGQRALLQGLKKDVLDLGVETGISSVTIAEGLYETISAFGDAENSVNKLTTATKMAKAGGSDVKEALSLLSAVTKGYGDTSDAAAQKVSDLSFLTVELGQTTFPDLAASIGKVVPLATTLGEKQANLFGYFATLTGVTGNAAEVSTQLASAYGAFIKPSTAMTKAVKKAGYESTITMVRELGLIDALKKLNAQVDGNELKLGAMLTRKEGLNAALTLLGPQADNLTDKIRRMSGAAGSTAKAFKEKTDGINKAGNAFRKLTELGRRFMISVGDKLAPILLDLAEDFKPLTHAMNNLSDESLTTMIKVAGALAVIGPAVFIIGKLATAVTFLTGVLGGGGLAAAFAVITGPIGLAVAAVAALVAGIVFFWDELAPLREAILEPLVDVMNEVKDIFSGTSDGFSEFISFAKALVSIAAKIAAPFVKAAVSLLALPLKYVVRGVHILTDVIGVLSSAFKVVIKVLQFAWAWLSKMWSAFTEGTVVGKFVAKVINTVAEAFGFVGDIAEEAWRTVKNVFDDITGWLDEIGVELDNATKKQEKLKANIGADTKGPSPVVGGALALDEGVISRMNLHKESNFNITFEGLPSGVKARVNKASGGKVKVGRKGKVME